ncbi:nuclear transport factor 2 family protein [Lysobacter capsici]|uniref:nuclear transport factor 2 family protein n=1 Tax=Lysobacter capsici TaxID=435897 RepID=UPI0009E47212|nr:nuclear transport factor 2 family protein [Lysobacter capsici]
MYIVRFLRCLVLLLVGLATVTHARAADEDLERVAITRALTDYIDGSAQARPEQLRRAFHPDARLLLSRPGTAYWPVSVDEYVGWFSGAKAGQPTGRIGNVLSIDVEADTATVKAEILVPSQGARFIDLFLLRKLDAQWKIVAKTATREPSRRSADRVLFVLSSAKFHGASRLPAGVSFGEVVEAWDAFRAAGLTVDFVSPEGNAAPINVTEAGEFRSRFYDADLMYALEHTHAPSQIDPARYRAVYFVGGSNAIYGVPENSRLQDIARHVYERNGGVVSAVCHGTAGLVNLKLSDGSYLIGGKRISGYPEEFERQDAAYFKEFPFLIRKTVESRGGTFLTSARDQGYVVVDGRLVTGQNYLSAKQVAQAVVAILRKPADQQPKQAEEKG